MMLCDGGKGDSKFWGKGRSRVSRSVEGVGAAELTFFLLSADRRRSPRMLSLSFSHALARAFTSHCCCCIKTEGCCWAAKNHLVDLGVEGRRV